MAAAFIAGLFSLIALLFSGGGGNHNHHHDQQNSNTQAPGSQQVLVADKPADDANETPDGKKVTNVPTPALLPGLVGLGAAAIRKRTAGIVRNDD